MRESKHGSALKTAGFSYSLFLFLLIAPGGSAFSETCGLSLAELHLPLHQVVLNKIVIGIEKVVTFAHGHPPAGIVVSGRSGAIVGDWFTKVWRLQYPGQPIPPLYDLGEEGNRLLYKVGEGPQGYRQVDDPQRLALVKEFLQKKFPQLLLHRDQPLLYIDDHSRTGIKMSRLTTAFAAQGFTHVQKAVYVASELARLDNTVIVGNELPRGDAVVLQEELNRVSEGLGGKK